MFDAGRFATIKLQLQFMLKNARELSNDDRIVVNNAIYTMQQTVGAALDALPAGLTNTAREINGDLFEGLSESSSKNWVYLVGQEL